MPTTRPGARGANPFEQARLAARELLRITGADRFDVLVVLGTGLAPAGPLLGAEGPGVDLSNLPWFARYAGRPEAWILEVGGARTLVVTGRVHVTQDPAEVVHPVRTAVAAGATTVVLVNSAAPLEPALDEGQVVAVADHLNLSGSSPLTGVAPEQAPGLDLTHAWSPRLRDLARQVDAELVEAVYAQVAGPELPTPAEARMLATMGAGMVGMSGVLEAVAARHLDAEVLGLAVIAARLVPDAVDAAASLAAKQVARLVTGVLDRT
jgi:purine-nucleoside phosphorylase